jgi:tetratricopeptide (TPR) repeat protein
VADSTQTALKEFAKGDYLLYQNRNQEAIAQFQSILEKYKGQEMAPLRLGKIYEKTANYNLALSQYQEIIDHHNDGIYIDEALFFQRFIIKVERNRARPLYEK